MNLQKHHREEMAIAVREQTILSHGMRKKSKKKYNATVSYLGRSLSSAHAEGFLVTIPLFTNHGHDA